MKFCFHIGSHATAVFRFIALVLIICAFANVNAQNISRAEYFFDTDPGVGNGTDLNVPVPSDNVTFTSTISTSELAPGYHILFIRTKSSDDHWSLYDYKEFVIEAPIQDAEYFFDVDPGVGNGFPLTVPAGQLSFSPVIQTTGLNDGEHILFLRTKQANRWSLSDPRLFYIRARIVEAEYFIDTDPGFGSGTPITIVSPSDDVTVTETIGVGELLPGPHYLFVRTKDILGNWSFYEAQAFTVDHALPIELKDLKATVTDDESVTLTWVTLSENTSHYFSVMHSEDGKVFSEFAQVPAAGESKIPRNYSAIDRHPVFGNNYYQLKMVDLDGQTSFSTIVVAPIRKVTGPAVYPNPVSDRWVIDFSRSEDAGIRTIDLFDVCGRKRLSFTTSNERIVHMTRGEFTDGVYVLKITSAQGTNVYKLHFR